VTENEPPPPLVSANGWTIEDVCLGYSPSHILQWHFLGLSSSNEMGEKIKVFENLVVRVDDGCLAIDYKKTLKVIEVELAFLYEVYFSSTFTSIKQRLVASGRCLHSLRYVLLG
jgi:hypothetical protein